MHKVIVKRNIYDIILIVIIALLFFGGLGKSFQPIRVFSAAIFLFLFIKNYSVFLKTKRQGLIILYFFLFVCYSVLSLTWTADPKEGFKAILYSSCHITIFLNIIICWHKSIFKTKSLLFGWYIFVLLTIPIALYELIYDQHLSISFYDSDKISFAADGTEFLKRFSSVTFGNYNTYVMVLIFSLPFLYARLLLLLKHFQRLMSIALLIAVNIIILVNASRGGIFAAFCILCIFVLLKKGKDFYVPKVMKYLLLLLLISFVSFIPLLFEQISYRLLNRGFFEDSSRRALYNIAFEITNEYLFLGAGAGSIEALMESKRASINIPHNFFLEISAQYGVLFLLPILWFIVRLVFEGMTTKLPTIKVIFLTAVISMPFAFLINSGYLYHPILWVYFASLYVLLGQKTTMLGK